MRKRLLLIAYYFPPLGLSGVQRVLKWAKYLPESGWDITVLTARPGSYFARDESLLDDLRGRDVEIVRTPSIDPTRWVSRRDVRFPGESRRRVFAKISQTIFQPDNKIGWYPFAVSAGKNILSNHHFDAIYSSAPPYTAHLIGAALSRFSGVPLILDYRDDWINNPRHHYASRWHLQLANRQEQSVFKTASAITTINDAIKSELTKRVTGQISEDQIRVFPHGFDPDDFMLPADANGTDITADRKPGTPVEFVYSGVFYDAQKPDIFLRGLAGFLNKHGEARPAIRARFIGLVPDYTLDLVIQLGLDDVVILEGYLNHSAAARVIANADVLWMTVGEGEGSFMISTSKLFEYFGTGNPILGLVPEGTARKALGEYGAAEIVDPDDIAGATMAIRRLYNASRSGLSKRGNEQFIEQFDRKRLAAKLAAFLDQLSLSEREN